MSEEKGFWDKVVDYQGEKANQEIRAKADAASGIYSPPPIGSPYKGIYDSARQKAMGAPEQPSGSDRYDSSYEESDELAGVLLADLFMCLVPAVLGYFYFRTGAGALIGFGFGFALLFVLQYFMQHIWRVVLWTCGGIAVMFVACLGLQFAVQWFLN